MVGSDPIDQALGPQDEEHPRLDPGESEAHTLGLGQVEDLAQLGRALRIDEADPLKVEHECPERLVAGRDLAHPLVEGLRRGEEQPTVEAEDDDPRERLVGRVQLDVAEDLGAGLASEEGHRRPGGHVDQPDEREPNPDHDPEQDPGQEHPGDRRQGNPEVEPGDPRQTSKFGQVDHSEEHGVDDDRSEDGLGQLREERREQDQGQDDEEARDQRGERRPGPGGLVQRAGRQAGRYGHPLDEPRRDIGHTLGDRLLVHVDPVVVAGREGAGVAGGLGEADQDEGHRGDPDLGHVLADELEAWDLGQGQAARHRSDEGHAARVEVEQVGGEQPTDDQDQGARDLRREEPQPEDRAEGGNGHHEGGRMDRSEPAEPRHELGQDVRTIGRRPGQLRQLAHDHVDRGPGQETGHDGLRQELGDPAQAEGRHQQEQQPGDQGDRGHELGRALAGQAGHDHRPAGDRGQGRARPGRDVARGAEQGVDDRPGRRRVQPVLDRHARDLGIAQVLGHDHRRDRDPGDHVSPQPRPIVPGQPRHDREEPPRAGYSDDIPRTPPTGREPPATRPILSRLPPRHRSSRPARLGGGSSGRSCTARPGPAGASRARRRCPTARPSATRCRTTSGRRRSR